MSLGNLGTVGAGQAPAKFGFDVSTASCTADYVAFTTSLAGSSSSPSIVGFNELYSTQGSVGGFCSMNGPSVKWAYNTNPAGDTTGTTLTSAAVSLDGTKVAFVESRTNANGGAILHILNWKPTVQGSIGAPAMPDTILAAGQSWTTNCPAANSCISNIILSGAQPDTNSPPFVDYAADVIYVGDDNGVLHKITGVFLGAPAEVLTGGWPVTVHTGFVLTGPVFDATSRNIFVGDSNGQLSFVREAGSTVGTCGLGSPPCLGSANAALGGSLIDSPIVDSAAGRVLVVDGTDSNNGSAYQFDTGLTAGSKVTASIRGSGVGSNLYSGTFDDAYFSIGPGSGHLYTCGKDPANTDRPAMYRLSFNGSGVLTSAGTPLVNLVSADGVQCSPVTELLNGGTDQIFFSVTNSSFPPAFVGPLNLGGNATGCSPGFLLTPGGCVMSIALGSWPPATTTAGIPASGGSSGIVVDNVGAGAQESSLYYTYLSGSITNFACNGNTAGMGCAVKATQSGLN